MPFRLSAEQNRTNRVDLVRLVRLSSVIELTEITEPIEQQSNDWVRLSSIDFWLGFVRLTTPGILHKSSQTNDERTK